MIVLPHEMHVMLHLTSIKLWIHDYQFSASGLVLTSLMRKGAINIDTLTSFVLEFIRLCHEISGNIPQEIVDAIVAVYEYFGEELTQEEKDHIYAQVDQEFSQEVLESIPEQLRTLAH